MRYIKSRENLLKINEVFENDITWGGSLLGRLINSSINLIMRTYATNLSGIDSKIKQFELELDNLLSSYMEESDQIIKLKALLKKIIESVYNGSEPSVFLGEKEDDSKGLITETIDLLESIRSSKLPQDEKDLIREKLEGFREDLKRKQDELEYKPTNREDLYNKYLQRLIGKTYAIIPLDSVNNLYKKFRNKDFSFLNQTDKNQLLHNIRDILSDGEFLHYAENNNLNIYNIIYNSLYGVVNHTKSSGTTPTSGLNIIGRVDEFSELEKMIDPTISNKMPSIGDSYFNAKNGRVYTFDGKSFGNKGGGKIPTINGNPVIGRVNKYSDLNAIAPTAKRNTYYFNTGDMKLYLFDGNKFEDEGKGVTPNQNTRKSLQYLNKIAISGASVGSPITRSRSTTSSSSITPVSSSYNYEDKFELVNEVNRTGISHNTKGGYQQNTTRREKTTANPDAIMSLLRNYGNDIINLYNKYLEELTPSEQDVYKKIFYKNIKNIQRENVKFPLEKDDTLEQVAFSMLNITPDMINAEMENNPNETFDNIYIRMLRDEVSNVKAMNSVYIDDSNRKQFVSNCEAILGKNKINENINKLFTDYIFILEAKPIPFVLECWKNNFTEEEEKKWALTLDEATQAAKNFNRSGINIDTGNPDPLMRIVNLFTDAYNIYATDYIPSGRPGGKVSNRTFRRYVYLGDQKPGTPDSPGYGPWGIKSAYDKWHNGVMKILENPKYKEVLANPHITINNTKGGGQKIMEFVIELLNQKGDIKKIRESALKKYFNIDPDKTSRYSSVTTPATTGVSTFDKTNYPVKYEWKTIDHLNLKDGIEGAFLLFDVKYLTSITTTNARGNTIKKFIGPGKDKSSEYSQSLVASFHVVYEDNGVIIGKWELNKMNIPAAYMKTNKANIDIPSNLTAKNRDKDSIYIVEINTQSDKLERTTYNLVSYFELSSSGQYGDAKKCSIAINSIRVLVDSSDDKVVRMSYEESNSHPTRDIDITKDINTIKNKLAI